MKVEGMTCSSCARTVSKYLEGQGMKEVYVDFGADEVRFVNAVQKPLSLLEKGIDSLGYHVAKTNVHQAEKRPVLSTPEQKFWFTLPFTVLLMMHMLPGFHAMHNGWLQLILCLPVAWLGFKHFGRSGWQSVKVLVPNMDVLIFMGSFSAFVYSLILLFFFPRQAVYFETTASIITLVLLGNLIEKRSVKQTTTAINSLSKLQPEKALKVLHDLVTNKEVTEEIAVQDVKVGDRLLVNDGSRIPVDGEVLRGEALADESMLTGESMPVGKRFGSAVIGGSLITDGSIYIKATQVGQKTLLSQIIEQVKRAKADKPSIQKLGDRIAAIFVPVVAGIAVFVFCINYWGVGLAASESLLRSIAVLVISCPCAMGLATPLAVMVGLGKAAKKGILVKGGSVLENLAQIDTVVLDKTGTLTNGDFEITRFETFDFNERDAKNIIHHLETQSNHPVAKSIVKKHEDWHHHNIVFSEVKEEKGLGIKANDHFGNKYTLGSPALQKNQKSDNPEFDIYLTRNGITLAAFDLSDTFMLGAMELISLLRASGINTILLSGDSEKKCREVQTALGIGEVYFRKTPGQKVSIVKKLCGTNKVAMLGDGINDALALTASHVGVSISGATDVARDAADVVLLKGITALPQALNTGIATYKTIRQNLFWAFLYNVVAIPLAAAGFLSPMLAALGMAFSDLVVVGNSLRIKLKK